MPRHAANSRKIGAAGVISAAAALSWIGFYRFDGQLDGSLAISALVLLVLVFSVLVPARATRDAPVAQGRVVAIIPAFNETPEALHATVRSLLDCIRRPDEIHVVDDGSHKPIPEFHHPQVFWHRQFNGGKRHAQATALRYARSADFILTVDSDCAVDQRAIHRLLRAMSDERVQAATGLPLTRNRKGWLTRVVDLEIASICLTYRAARSRLGSLTTCSGALSLYRAAVVLDNLDDYVSAPHSYGDDRRLTHYAMQRGQVVSISDAVVDTDMPTTLRKLYRQRVRWSSSHWRYTLWEIGYLRTGPMLWACYHLVLSLIVPAALALSLVAGQWQLLVYWTVACWALNLKYAVGRPDMRAAERWAIWLLGTPALVLLHVLVLRPAMIHALLQLRHAQWGTRGSQGRHRFITGRYRMKAAS